MNNKELIDNYPFLKIDDPFWEVINDDEENACEITELDSMPIGWRKAFGEQLCEELKQELIKIGYLYKYRVYQIKEKYGALRWYGNIETDNISNILSKYEKKSRYTCIKCGAPATKISRGWISPYCDKCTNSRTKYEEIKKFWKSL